MDVLSTSDVFSYPQFTIGTVYFKNGNIASAKMNYSSLWDEMHFINSKGDTLAMADENKFEQAKGNVKETVGNVTDNKDLENEGKEDKTSGKAKEFVENAKDKANDAIDKFKK